MPTLKTFAARTGLPRQRRWGGVYEQIKVLQARGPQPAPAPLAPVEKPPEPEPFYLDDLPPTTISTPAPIPASVPSPSPGPKTPGEIAALTGLPEKRTWPEVYEQIGALSEPAGIGLYMSGYMHLVDKSKIPLDDPLTAHDFAKFMGLERKADWRSILAQIALLRSPSKRPAGVPLPPAAPSIAGVAREIEVVAQWLVRGFHDWNMAQDFPPGQGWLEPGIRQILDRDGNPQPEDYGFGWYGPTKRRFTIKYDALRADWADDFMRALDKWAALGFDFVNVNHWTPDYGTMNYLPDIEVDDERPGGYLHSNFSTAIDGHNQRYVWFRNAKTPVVHTSLRKINVSKRWMEEGLQHAFLHELGHALGLGHGGRYPTYSKPPGPVNWDLRPAPGLVGLVMDRPRAHLAKDDANYTVMSYLGRASNEIGEVDRVAIEMLYG